tara:strand:+ start:442 stop:1062 length:621 start_codon:yes stop_codon:yes gene_type:complete
MPCTVTQGRGIDCRDAVGGIESIFILTDGSDNPLTIKSAFCTITASEIADVEAGAAEEYNGSESYEVELVKNSGSFTTAIVGSPEGGTFYYTETLEFTLHKVGHDTQDWLDSLARNRCSIGVLDNNGQLFCAGFEKGLEITSTSATTGGTFADGHMVTVTMEGQSAVPTPLFKKSAGRGTANFPFDTLTTPTAFALQTDSFSETLA